MLFGMALQVFAVCCYAQWSATDNDALATTKSERRSSYIIKKGDTLWDLAFQFLGDPFKWPELWHANASIKNPNLIYPGDHLVIPAPGNKSPAAGDGAPETESMSSLSAEDAQKDNESRSWGLSEKENAEENSENSENLADSLMSITVLRNDFFTAELVLRAGFLWFNKDRKGLIYPGNASITNPGSGDALKKESNTIYRQFDEIVIAVFGKNTYAVGDTVDVFHSDRFVKFKGKTANLVRRIGRARVTGVAGDRLNAMLFKAWDIVSEGDRIDTVTRFPTWEIDTLLDRDVVIRGTVFERIEPTESPYLFHSILCDRGTQDGVRFGDIFLVHPQGESKSSGHPSALGCVIHAGIQSSTLVIEKLFDIAIAPGDTVELVKRIRFK
jgi:hypothetical protein